MLIHTTADIPRISGLPAGWRAMEYAYSTTGHEAVVIANNPDDGGLPWVCWSHNREMGGCALGQYGEHRADVRHKFNERLDRIKRYDEVRP